MKVSALKIWNDLNPKKLDSVGTKKWTYLNVTDYDRFNWGNNNTYDLQCTYSNNDDISYKHAF